MTTTPPDFTGFSRIEDRSLSAELDAVRATLTHAAEKGRVLEQAATSLLRKFLPAEYGLSTGFVAYHGEAGVSLTPQLDIIIYDAVRTGPLVRLPTCDIFPIEAVHGYVEVKASIRSSSDDAEELAHNSVERCLSQNRELRKIIERRFYTPSGDSSVGARRVVMEWTPMRGYVMAFAAEGTIASSPGALAQRIADVSRTLGSPTHLHGVFVAGCGFFRTRPVDSRRAKPEEYWHVNFVTHHHGLSAFKADLLHGLARYDRFQDGWTPAIGDYFHEPTWETKTPA